MTLAWQLLSRHPPPPDRSMSPITLFTLSGVLHGYIGMRLVPALPFPWGALLTVVLLVSAVMVPLGLVSRRLMRLALADTIAAIGLFFMGLFSSLLVGTFLRDVMLVVAHTVELLHPSWTGIEALERVSGWLVPA